MRNIFSAAKETVECVASTIMACCEHRKRELFKILTPGSVFWIAGSDLFSSTFGTKISNFIVLGLYIFGILWAIQLIFTLDKVLHELEGYPPSPPHERDKPKCKRRKFKKKGHFYGRSKHRTTRAPGYATDPKRIRYLRRLAEERERTVRAKKDAILLDGWSNLPLDGWWRYSIARDFSEVWDSLCEVNPMLISMTLNKDFIRSMSNLIPFDVYNARTTTSLGGDWGKIADGNFQFQFEASYHLDHDDGPELIFDSGASIAISPVKSDFIQLDQNKDSLRGDTLGDLTSAPEVAGKGIVRWQIFTDNGFPRIIEQEAYFVPAAKVRLFSVHNYCLKYKKGSAFVCNEYGVHFRFPSNLGGGKITFDVRRTGRLPSTTTNHQKNKENTVYHNTRLHHLVQGSNINLTCSQKELLKWHFRLGHFNMQWIQSLFRSGIIHSKDKKVTLPESICQCAACNLGKQVRKSEGTVKHKLKVEKDGNLKKDQLKPGGCVSTDQYVSSVAGRLPNTYGKERESEKYVGGTLFTDEASGFTFIKNQVSLGAAETIRAKHEFEREARRHGVAILGYRGDNGVYKSKEFRDDLEKFKQTIQFSPVGGHHHNGIAERAIRTITTCARTMMLHALIHNPTEVQADLWPFAMEYATYLWNKMPRRDGGLSPEEVFYSIKSDYSHIKEARTWGCPAYVLDPKLQDGKKLPRWKPRSRLGQFMGRSREHASNVGLIRNLRTGAVSPQFNVVYDDHFTTVGADTSLDNIPVPDGFDELMRFSRENVLDPADLNKTTIDTISTNADNSQGSASIIPNTQQNDNSKPTSEGVAETIEERTSEAPTEEPSAVNNDGTGDIDATPSEGVASTDANEQQSTSRYPTRVRKRPDWFHEKSYISNVLIPSDIAFHDLFLYESTLDRGHCAMTAQFDAFNVLKMEDNDEELLEGIHPLAFSARASAEDTPRWNDAMNGPDAEGFRKAMDDEIELLESLDSWDVVPREKAIREGKRVLDSVWSFKRKRFPNGEVKKLKARFCVRGDQQRAGIDFDETFSPVVGWSTIRIMLNLSIMLELKTKQVDFTLAFVQAKLPPGRYIEMPRCFEQEGMILELKRNLYGGCDAGMNFFLLLKTELEKRGFRPSASDPCLFINEKTGCMILCYVDDCVLFHESEKVIDATLKDLEDPKDKTMHKFLIKVEDDYAGFLGIDIKRHKDGRIELLQIGLIDRILVALNLDGDDVITRLEPAAKETLGKDENGPKRMESWSYPSIIGMLLYLASNSRPDIAFAVHQCCRFNHCPKLIHEKAVKRIARYLKGTKTSGLIFDPNKNLRLEMYCDADFAGLWNSEKSDDPVCVKSRSGVVITFGDVPICWSSKLQSEIATSTMHAEYIALSLGMRDLIPIKRQVDEICEILKVRRDEQSRVVVVHEDNEGALKLANSPLMRVTPLSKHFAVKYHWFREKLDEFKIKIKGVRTHLQKADIFTKGLQKTAFRDKRRLIMGW